MPFATVASSLPLLDATATSTTLVESTAEPEVLPEISTADLTTFSASVNENSAATDLLTRLSVGGYGIVEGLTIGNSGLTLTIAVGKALIDGVVVLESADTRTIVVPSSTSTVYVWLRQSKSLTYTTNTTPPSGKALLLGRVTTDGSGVTATDYSGVIYVRGGQCWRSTGDTWAPTDTPPADMRLWTVTSGGTYYWDGTKHCDVTKANFSPQWTKTAITRAMIQTAATTNTITLVTLPIGSVVHAVILDVTAFSGASISALALDVGISGTATKYINGANGLVTGSSNSTTVYVESRSGTTAVQLKATSTGADLSALSAGSANAFVLWSAPV